ncbi:hypothetical protein ACFLTE_03150 [Bacteroidota bacterium]
MREIGLILLFVIGSINLVGGENGYSQINYIPRIGKPHHETVQIKADTSLKAYKETYLNGLIKIYRHCQSEKNIFVVIDNDTLYFDKDQNITNGYKTEYYDEFEYLIVTKYDNEALLWSKGYYLGEDIIIQNESFKFELKTGTVLSTCRCNSSENSIDNLKWIQFYDGQNIKRLQLYDKETQIERNVEFYYPGNKVAVTQTYYNYFEHTDSIFNRKGELLNVYEYDAFSNLQSEENNLVNNILFTLIESDYAWDFFYPFNHCGESMLVGSNF